MPNKTIGKFGEMGVGLALTAVFDGALEVYWEHNQLIDVFPFVRPIEFLPPVDQWIVLGIPAAAYAYTRKKGSEKTKNAALGALIYGAGIFIHDTGIAIYNYLKKEGILLQEVQARRAVAPPCVAAPRVAVSPTAPSTQTLLV